MQLRKEECGSGGSSGWMTLEYMVWEWKEKENGGADIDFKGSGGCKVILYSCLTLVSL